MSAAKPLHKSLALPQTLWRKTLTVTFKGPWGHGETFHRKWRIFSIHGWVWNLWIQKTDYNIKDNDLKLNIGHCNQSLNMKNQVAPCPLTLSWRSRIHRTLQPGPGAAAWRFRPSLASLTLLSQGQHQGGRKRTGMDDSSDNHTGTSSPSTGRDIFTLICASWSSPAI
nr:uncharacterized protein LOC112429606 isoform X1 [Macaca nemestrina]